MFINGMIRLLIVMSLTIGVFHSTVAYALTDNFESGSLEDNWINAGSRFWSVSSATSVDPIQGNFAAVTRTQAGENTVAVLQSATDTRGGTVTFFARTESQSSLNELVFSIDGVVQTSISGTTPWTRYQFQLTPGAHILSWVYEGDSFFSDGAAFVDNISGPQQNLAIFNNVSEGENCAIAESSLTVSDFLGPIEGLTRSNFRVFVNDERRTDFDLEFVGNGNALNTALVMDYSGSLSRIDENNAESAAAQFVNQMDSNDRSTIIKFASRVERTQALTANRSALIQAAFREPDVGSLTAFYDGVLRGIQDIDETTGDRVVIAYTDGFENNSFASLQQIITSAVNNDVRVFTVGLGSFIDEDELRLIASSTGGQFVQVEQSASLASLYQTLRSEAGSGQYEISLESFPNAEIRIEVTTSGRTATVTREFRGCPVLPPIYEVIFDDEE